MTAPAIELADVSKRFGLRPGLPHGTTLKSAVVDVLLRRRTARAAGGAFAALDRVDLSVAPGRMLGVIGRNGSGKSTLLKIIAGIYRPDSGRVTVRGRVASLIELGAGFHPEFTGRENAILHGTLLGLTRREVLQRLDAIVDFAELGAFVDQPIRTYSSGMQVRLGFAVAVHLDPDVLLVDEVLAVGDEAFARKCANRISEFRRMGKTIVLVTHDPFVVERWCDEALWLDRGSVRAMGTPRKVLDEYHQVLAAGESDALRKSYEAPAGDALQRWGSGEIEIEGVRLVDGHGQERYVFAPGEPLTIALQYRVRRPVADAAFGFAVLRADGLWVYGTNTDIAAVVLPPLGAAGTVEIAVERLDLVAGSYFVDVAVHGRDGTPYDYHSRRYPLAVTAASRDVGVARIPHRWRVRPD